MKEIASGKSVSWQVSSRPSWHTPSVAIWSTGAALAASAKSHSGRAALSSGIFSEKPRSSTWLNHIGYGTKIATSTSETIWIHMIGHSAKPSIFLASRGSTSLRHTQIFATPGFNTIQRKTRKMDGSMVLQISYINISLSLPLSLLHLALVILVYLGTISISPIHIIHPKATFSRSGGSRDVGWSPGWPWATWRKTGEAWWNWYCHHGNAMKTNEHP